MESVLYNDSTHVGPPHEGGIFSGIEVPYIVIIWVVALAASVLSIVLCCVCGHLQKRSHRLRQAQQAQNQDSKINNKNLTPIKIANPLSCRDSCAICCETYVGASESDLTIGYIRPCGHYFHRTCAWRWVSARETCPLCRNPVSLRKCEMTSMTLNELEVLLGVPNGTLRRDKKAKLANELMTGDKDTRLNTISLTMNLPVDLVLHTTALTVPVTLSNPVTLQNQDETL